MSKQNTRMTIHERDIHTHTHTHNCMCEELITHVVSHINEYKRGGGGSTPTTTPLDPPLILSCMHVSSPASTSATGGLTSTSVESRSLTVT